MRKIKKAVMKIVSLVTLAAVTTHFFTGCSNDPVTSSDLYAPSQVYDIEEGTPSLTDEMTPGINETDTDSFSIKYKYWYDNPEVKEAQEQSLAEANQNPGSLTNKNFLNLDSLPIYTDSEGNEYIISGRTKVYLVNGKITGSEVLLLRNNLGRKVYITAMNLADIISKATNFENYLKENNITQPATLEERQTQDSSANETKEVVGDKQIYVNNITTDYTTSNGMIPVLGIFQGVSGIGSLDMTKHATDNVISVTLYTAAGFVEVTFTTNDDKVNVSYSTGLEGTSLVVGEEYDLNSSTILLTADALERILGYDVEVYDDFINIVTDNQDLFSSSQICVVDSYDVEKIADHTKDVQVSDLDPVNPIPVSKPATQEEKDKAAEEAQQKEDAKPEVVGQTSDGKYDLTAADIVNPDGTYTQDPINNPVVPECLNERIHEGTLLRDYTNPSKIPYSQITLENAAEAFPYLGFTGETPDYIEIMPGDSKKDIETKILCNYKGMEPSRFFSNGLDVRNMEAPEHVYKTEAEYKQALAEWDAEQQRLAEAQARAEAFDPSKGDRILDDLTEEEVNSLWDTYFNN